ncbi:MAG: hypothetical protein Q9174_001901 [Haloplaca sp. 1 TL-2023]
MPIPSNPRKLLKNPNALLEATQHLRPRGSYDPLPPPGGYPLPAYIRRKFSFAPQLSEISLLSLMPDFASSSLELGNTADDWDDIDELEIQQTAFGTPFSLQVQYTPKKIIPKMRQPAPKHTPVEAPPIFYSSSTSRNPIFCAIQSPSPVGTPLKSYDLRRVRGQKALYGTGGSVVSSDVVSEHSTVSPYTTPRSSIDFSRAESSEFSSLEEAISPSGPSEFGQADHQMTNGLIKRLSEQSPNLFKSFCIIDLQLEGNPIRCTSQDMAPIDLDCDECLYLDENSIGKPFELHMMTDGQRKIPTVPIQGGLVNIRDGSVCPSHRFLGHVILANEHIEGDEDFDVWFAIAEEEMEKAGIRRTYQKGKGPMDQACFTDEKVPEAVESLHRDYFVIGIADKETKEWAITMASPTLLASKMQSPSFFDFGRFGARLDIPERFVCHVVWQTKGLRDRVYLVPMIGPKGLVAWLAFLVDQGLPNLW